MTIIRTPEKLVAELNFALPLFKAQLSTASNPAIRMYKDRKMVVMYTGRTMVNNPLVAAVTASPSSPSSKQTVNKGQHAVKHETVSAVVRIPVLPAWLPQDRIPMRLVPRTPKDCKPATAGRCISVVARYELLGLSTPIAFKPSSRSAAPILVATAYPYGQ